MSRTYPSDKNQVPQGEGPIRHFRSYEINISFLVVSNLQKLSKDFSFFYNRVVHHKIPNAQGGYLKKLTWFQILNINLFVFGLFSEMAPAIFSFLFDFKK